VKRETWIINDDPYGTHTIPRAKIAKPRETLATRDRDLTPGGATIAFLSSLLVRDVVKVMCQAFPAMNPRPTLPAFHPLRLALFWQQF